MGAATRRPRRSRGKEEPLEQLPLRLVVPLLCAACVSEGSWERRQAAILDGQIDRGDPSVVYLSMGGGACTGSVIDPRLVLTAKHCVMDEYGGGTMDPGIFEVYSGDNPYGGDGQTIASQGDIVAVQVFDDGWDIDGVDIALLQAGSDLDAEPIPFSTDERNPAVGDEVEAAGYGQYDDWNGPDGNKRRGSGVVQDNMGNEIDTTPITCYGDSGGPLFDAQGTVIGITSRGTSDVCSAGDDIYTNVGHFADWISGYLSVDPVEPEDPDAGDAPGGEPGDGPEDPGENGDTEDPGEDPGGDPVDEPDTDPGVDGPDDGPLGDFGDPCSEGGACDSNACVALSGGDGYCTEACTGESCPYGFECRDTAQGSWCLLPDDEAVGGGGAPAGPGYRGLESTCSVAPGAGARSAASLLWLGLLLAALLARRFVRTRRQPDPRHRTPRRT